jgi:endo-1,4-beta-xylanase
LERNVTKILSAILVCSVALLCCGIADASAQSDLLSPGVWQFSTPDPSDAVFAQTKEDGAPGDGNVLSVTVNAQSDPLWLIQIQKGIPSDVPTGDQLKLRFWARSSTLNPIRVTIEQTAPPNRAVAEAMISLTPTWKEYTVQGNSFGLGLNALSAHFQAGAQKGIIEMSDVTVVDDGIDPALAAAQKAVQPGQIQKRIDEYRKGNLSIHVVDSEGKPVKSASVSVTQTRHAFLFGCNIFNLNPSDNSPKQIAYQNEFAALFNYATLPFYWGSFEAREGEPNYDGLEAMAEWCVKHGIAPKGHPLVWHEVYPRWAPTDPDASIPLLKARVYDLIPRYKDTIHYWDVVNEANNAAQTRPANGESNWIKRDGPAAVVGTALGWARDAGKGLTETFVYNDFNVDQPNVDLLTQLQARNELPDAIGLQSHMHSGVWPLTRVWQVCQTFSQFHRPLHFTEITVLSGPNRPSNEFGPNVGGWDSTPEVETQQADYVVKFYSVLFSNPSVQAITWWDFSDWNAWQGAPAGLVFSDMKPKPAYTALLKLIRHDWWTKTDGVTNRAGNYSVRAFYGDYDITVTDAGGRVTTVHANFPESSPPLTVTVRLGSDALP